MCVSRINVHSVHSSDTKHNTGQGKGRRRAQDRLVESVDEARQEQPVNKPPSAKGAIFSSFILSLYRLFVFSVI